jgi:PAS domain S-box-containing protein
MDSISDDAQVASLLRKYLAADQAHAIITIDLNGLVTGWLCGAEHILGYRAEEIVGHNISRIFTPEDRQKGIDGYELAVASEHALSEDERWHVRKDGTRIWVTGTMTALKDDGGRLLGFVKVMRDRTDLRTRIERQDAEVQKLHDARDRVEIFLQTLGHELRNPLGALSFAAQLIGRGQTAPGPMQATQVIKRQIAVLQGLADDLMDMARIETDNLELRPERLKLQAIIRDAEAAFREQCEKKHQHLTAMLPEVPIFLDADPNRLQQVLLNLIGNAVKYTPSGGRIWIKAVEEAGEAVIRIQDTGIGISAEMLPRIFEFFTQDAAAKKHAPGGLGVGLAVVRQLVELHHGTVAARSGGAGKGSEFVVRLPLAQRPPVPAHPMLKDSP